MVLVKPKYIPRYLCAPTSTFKSIPFLDTMPIFDSLLATERAAVPQCSRAIPRPLCVPLQRLWRSQQVLLVLFVHTPEPSDSDWQQNHRHQTPLPTSTSRGRSHSQASSIVVCHTVEYVTL